MRRRERGRAGARLFAVYAAASLVPVGVLGAVLMRGYHDDGLNHALDQGRAQAAVIEQMAVAPAIDDTDLSYGLSRSQRERLQSATDLAIFHGSVVKLRLLSFDGTAFFSDDGSLSGAVPVDDPAFRAATAGRVDARIQPAGHGSPASIRVLQPVIAGANGQSVGVLEVVLPYDAIAAKVQADTSRTILRLAVGLVGLYAVLAGISWWSTRTLRRHAANHEHQALHDPLTGLPNRELFRRTVEESRSRRPDAASAGALVLIDLDHFKEVNDTLGHHAGDELLQIVGRRLAESLRTDDTVARLGGDEFGIVLPHAPTATQTVALLTRVRDELGREITLDGATLSVEASFGVCFYPEDADTVEGLLQHADAAMYRGKHGPAGVVVYEPDRRAARHRRAGRAARAARGAGPRRVRAALPAQDRPGHRPGQRRRGPGPVAAPERGLLPPPEFLPRRGAVRAHRAADPVGASRRALRDYADWTAAGHDWTVAVNVSARNLSSLQLVDRVLALLEDARVPAGRLHLEVTETAMAFDGEIAGAGASGRWRSWASRCRSTTSAPASRPVPAAHARRVARSRSTAPSSPTWPTTSRTRRSCAPSSTSATGSGSA